MKKTSIQVIFDRTNPSHAQAFDLMKRHCGFFRVTEKKGADYIVRLAINSTLPPESYRVEKMGDAAFTVSAPDKLGMIHGVGRVLHRGPANLQNETCVPEAEDARIYAAAKKLGMHTCLGTVINEYYLGAPKEKGEYCVAPITLDSIRGNKGHI